jgi:hypothetical protein
MSQKEREEDGDRSGRVLDRRFPKLCKWNAFTIDRPESLCKDCQRAIGKTFPLY